MKNINKQNDDKVYLGEEWEMCTYPGIPKNKYMVSNTGRVYNLNRKQLLYNTEARGYLKVSINYDNKESKGVFVHRLVCWEFVDGYSETQNIVNHKDGVKSNNCVDNLEWVTPAKNVIHAIELGLTKVGEDHSKSIHTEEFVRSVCDLLEQGKNCRQILQIVLGDTYEDELKSESRRYRSIKNLVSGLRKGQCWNHVLKDYTFTRQSTEGYYDHEFLNTVRDLMYRGFDSQTVRNIITDMGYYDEKRTDYYRNIVRRMYSGDHKYSPFNPRYKEIITIK